MGILSLVEDRPTPKEVYNWKVYGLASVASFASCMIGYDSAFIGTTLALPAFVSEFKFGEMSADHLALVKANIVSVYQAGAFWGALFAYITNHYFGRKISLYIYSVVFCLGAGMMLGANADRGLGLIYGGRVLAGIGVGAASMTVPIYISELAPPAIRGRLVGIYELGWQVGGLVGFWINYGISETLAPSHSQWLIPFAVQLIPGGLLLIGTVWLKESPRWLLSKGKREHAIRNLCWIRGLPADHIYMVEEISYIDAALEEQTKGIGNSFWAPFKAVKRDRSIQWRLVLGCLLFMWQNGSGINAINYYSPTVFKSLGIQGTNTGFFTTGLFGVVKTVLTFVWLLFLIDHLGRRKLLMIGSTGGSLCMWYVGAYIKIAGTKSASNPDAPLTGAGISAIFFFYLWTAFYTPSWNGTPWVINSEMFPVSVRALGQASASASNWFWNFLISRFTPQMFLKMSYGVYFFFASLMILSVPFVYFLIPETKGIPLEAMDRLFATRPVYKAHPQIVAELQREEESFRHDAEGAGLDVAKEHFRSTHVEKTSNEV